MRRYLLAVALCSACFASAQTDDPVIMTVNGQPVQRSEFEYSYNKNNSDGVIDKKSVDEYVDLFINYKLKVQAALDAHLDTLVSFQKEFDQYRDQQIRPTLVTNADVEAEAHRVYEETKKNIGADGLIKPAHIFLQLAQKATQAEQDATKQRIDSIYKALKGGADFAAMAKKYSQDPSTAQHGGELPWLGRHQLLKEMEDAAFALKKGEMSKPVLSPIGYHIILMKDRKPLDPYDSLRTSIMRYLEQRNIRESIVDHKLDLMCEQSKGKLTKKEIMDQKADSLSALNPELKNLIREYHDGLLLYEISNRTVWDKAAKDDAALAQFFKKNRKKYAWAAPRFKGIAYHVKNEADIKGVKDCVKKLKFDQWAEALRKTFNNDSIIRIRVEKGIFKKGDNALVDHEVFKTDTVVKPMKDYPYDAVYGKVLKKNPEDFTDVRGLVTADYQDVLEKEWVAQLRQRYPVTVNKEILKTVNKH